MLYFISVKIDPKEMSLEELWNIWEKETFATLQAKESGGIKAVYKVAGQRRVLAFLNIETHDELDKMLMVGMPLSKYLEIEEITPVRHYENFAHDIKNRWK